MIPGISEGFQEKSGIFGYAPGVDHRLQEVTKSFLRPITLFNLLNRPHWASSTQKNVDRYDVVFGELCLVKSVSHLAIEVS